MRRIAERIPFSENGLGQSSRRTSAAEDERRTEQTLTVDLVSNGYEYDTSTVDLHVVQQCWVVSVISPHVFTIQLSRDVAHGEEFLKEMNDFYNSIDDLQIPLVYLRKNLLCVTYDESVHAWNRSQIMEFDSADDTVNVFFVDLNSWEENVARSRLRFILTKYSSRPVYLLACRLAGVVPRSASGQWHDAATKTFQNVIVQRRCDVEPLYRRCDQMFYVNLFADHDEAYVCVNDFLIHCRLARPTQDHALGESSVSGMLDDDGRTMHAMMVLYWKAAETTPKAGSRSPNEADDCRSFASTESSSKMTKTVTIDAQTTLVFARYKSYIMLPWFTLSPLLNEPDEAKIQKLAKQFGFKSVPVDPLSNPTLCSQLLKSTSPPPQSTECHLYSIDCIRRLFRVLQYERAEVSRLLDTARFAEATADHTFWDEPRETSPTEPTNRFFKLASEITPDKRAETRSTYAILPHLT